MHWSWPAVQPGVVCGAALRAALRSSAGREHALKTFGQDEFARSLDGKLQALTSCAPLPSMALYLLVYWALLGPLLAVMGLCLGLGYYMRSGALFRAMTVVIPSVALVVGVLTVRAIKTVQGTQGPSEATGH